MWGGDLRKVAVPICVTRRLSHHDSGLLFHAERTASGSQRPACKQKWASSLLVLKEEGREFLYHRLAHSSRAARGEEAPKKAALVSRQSGLGEVGEGGSEVPRKSTVAGDFSNDLFAFEH